MGTKSGLNPYISRKERFTARKSRAKDRARFKGSAARGLVVFGSIQINVKENFMKDYHGRDLRTSE